MLFREEREGSWGGSGSSQGLESRIKSQAGPGESTETSFPPTFALIFPRVNYTLSGPIHRSFVFLKVQR